MNLSSLRLTVLLALAGAVPVWAETPLNETRSTLEKWVETRQLVSRTRSDWQSDREMIEQTIALLERELRAVEEQMAKLGTNSVQVEKERTEAEALLKRSNDSLERTAQFAAQFEAKIRQAVPRLPAPLQEILKPSLNKLPEDPAKTTMTPAARIQVAVGILNDLDKFNNAVNILSEKRQNGKNEQIAVETVYVGLGAAYFVNDANDFAGIGSPGPNGWEWTVNSELAPSVREAIRIYKNERGARFVALPVVIR